ncbi:MAG: response regulator transcription factor [Deltaproteobacteria bacterium]|nr:response regulator transcription factor [Deltaproteobacteria bacterium]
MPDRILLIEDDPSILRGLELNLGLEGYEVRAAIDGPSGLRVATEWKPDLVLLDIMLPAMNGYEVCRELRRRGFSVPVIILSAKGTEPDKVMGLDIGADDFVTKPFGLAELLARIKAQLRRGKPALALALRFGDVEADFSAGEVRRKGELQEMTARELQLLQYLAKHEGRVVTRQMILDAVWGENYFGTERTVDNFITRLRQKLDDDDPRHFLTVRGMGYRFKGDSR